MERQSRVGRNQISKTLTPEIKDRVSSSPSKNIADNQASNLVVVEVTLVNPLIHILMSISF